MPLASTSAPLSTWGAWCAAAAALGVLLAVPNIRRSLARVGPLPAMVVAVCGVAVIAGATKRSDLFGASVWWLDDDMMISLRYAANCAEGHGLVWNPGERVEGITNFAWALFAVPLHFLLPLTHTSLGVIVLDTALLAGVVWLGHRLARTLGCDVTASLVAGLGLATWAPLLHWTAGGSEALLLAVLVTLMAVRVARAEAPGVVDGLLAGLAIVTRADAAVAVGVLLLAGVVRARPGVRRVLLVAVAAAVLPAAQLVFRAAYYGELLPNTYWLKATGWDGRLGAGWVYLGTLVLPLLGWLLPACAAGRTTLALGAAVAAHFAYVAWVGGDELPLFRFSLPVLPVLMALGAVGAQRLGRLLPPAVRGESLAPVLVLAVGGLSFGTLPGTVPALTAQRAMGERGNAAIGLLVRANTEPEATVAHFWAGAAAYFSQRPGVDMLGKCDPVIARQRAHPGLNAPGHNKYDFGVSLGRAPDVVIGGIGAAALGNAQALLPFARSDYRAFVDLYEHALFRRDWLPNLVGGGQTADPTARLLSLGWHGVFVRTGSQRARPAAQWASPQL